MTLIELKSFVNGLTSEDLKAMGLELQPKKKKTTKAVYFGYAGAFGGASTPAEAPDSGGEGGDGGGGGE